MRPTAVLSRDSEPHLYFGSSMWEHTLTKSPSAKAAQAGSSSGASATQPDCAGKSAFHFKAGPVGPTRVPTCPCRTLPQPNCTDASPDRTRTRRPGWGSAMPTRLISGACAAQPLRCGKSTYSFSRLHSFTTTPTSPLLTDPHLYLGSATSSRTVTRSPTRKPWLPTSSSSKLEQRQEDWCGKSTVTLLPVTAFTLPASRQRWEPMPSLGTATPSFSRTRSPTRNTPGRTATSWFMSADQLDWMSEKHTLQAPDGGASTTMPRSPARTLPQPCVTDVKLGSTRTRLPLPRMPDCKRSSAMAATCALICSGVWTALAAATSAAATGGGGIIGAPAEAGSSSTSLSLPSLPSLLLGRGEDATPGESRTGDTSVASRRTSSTSSTAADRVPATATLAPPASDTRLCTGPRPWLKMVAQGVAEPMCHRHKVDPDALMAHASPAVGARAVMGPCCLGSSCTTLPLVTSQMNREPSAWPVMTCPVNRTTAAVGVGMLLRCLRASAMPPLSAPPSVVLPVWDTPGYMGMSP